MKRRLLFGCLVPIVAIAGLGWWGYRRLFTKRPTPVRLARVDRGDVDIKVVETGAIEPLKKVEIKSKVAGRLARLYVKEGDRVVAGQVLAEIDPTEINSQVDQIRAQLDGARARLAQAMKGVGYQHEQTISSIAQAREAVKAAEARLQSARRERDAQPEIVNSDVRQAEASLTSAEKTLELLQTSTHPQALVQAQTGVTEAQAAADAAERNLSRQRSLLQRGFASQTAVDAATTEHAAALARLTQARKRLELMAEQHRTEIAEAQARVDSAKASLARARASAGLLPVQDDTVRSAQAALEQARAQLKAALAGEAQDRMREDDVAQARSAVQQIENQLQEFAVRQGDTRLVATMSGVVTKRYVEQGELITSGVSTFSSGTPVLQIADLSRMLVKATVNEVDVHQVRKGLPVEITIDGAKGVRFTGRVRQVSPAAVGPGEQVGGAQQGGGGAVIRFAVEVEVDKPDPRLRPGMSARCTIVVDRRRNVLRLPADAVEGDGDTATVQFATEYKKDGVPAARYEKRSVVAGLRGDSFIEIKSGLKVGDKVKPGVFKGPKRKAIQINFGEEN
ncbi:MAG: HlyD family efflux transporter periplasmic adaptor subunit [Chthonomonadales bacterium]|nr:HlyD family efflux transporter periplasmic adaptor subunit [Chthonomonadales bacterium]